MGINIHIAQATIEHINIRRKESDEQHILAVDLKLSGETNAESLAPAVGSDLIGNFLDALWTFNDASGEFEPRLLGVTEIKTWGDFYDHQATIGNNPEIAAHVRKISFRPLPGRRAEVTMTVTIESPTEGFMNSVCARIKDTVSLAIVAPPELDFGKPE